MVQLETVESSAKEVDQVQGSVALLEISKDRVLSKTGRRPQNSHVLN